MVQFFLFIGGEGELSSDWVKEGAWIRDLTMESLQYLSSKQALNDLRWFIQYMNSDYNMKYGIDENTKWIAFGGSYSGNLAAWLRLKSPDLVHGAVASSAPILAKVDFSDYFRVVAESIRIYSSKCINVTSQAIDKVNELIQGGTREQQVLDDKLHLCEPIQNFVNNSKYLSTLYVAITDNFAGAVQYDLSTRIGSICNVLTTKEGGEPIDRLSTVARSDGGCLDFNYNKTIANRQWIYQTCTEFGYFQSSSAHPSFFGHGFPVEYYIGICSDIFGQQFTADYITSQVDNTNRYYGGLDINVTNVVFVHGSIDPWHALGLTKTRNPKAPVIYIKGTSHCEDMGDINVTPEMEAVRRRISKYI
ncbi:hypothetical protein ILUMI_00171 [Ignelater luminosus]|uniref:Serine protease K12H4.7 n=1 Tax=Ignelater luminosus TaxID=2038154 RepID=A0A8K0DL03_IGNLU|nr:hypothetical protein ILUMI_00171 [Ignelater luminosus]